MQGYGGNPGPVFPNDDAFDLNMTAIALVPTPEGIVVAADGFSRWGDEATRDENTIRNESDCEISESRSVDYSIQVKKMQKAVAAQRSK